MGSGPL
jgi:plasmid stability protein